MQARRTKKSVISLLIGLAALATAVGAASCASSGAGENVVPEASTMDSTMGDDMGSEASSGSSSGGSGGCDADTQTDNFNCGTCGHACTNGQTCQCGACASPTCEGGLTACCGSCVDTTTDPNNCGSCGNGCIGPSGGSVPGITHCVASTCTFTCPTDAGVVQCNADAGVPGCYDLSNSTGACGACGTACTGTQMCSEGQCCAMGDGICNGVCTSLQTATSCGACDAGCPAPGQCMAGKCTGYTASYPPATFIDACTLPGNTPMPSLSGTNNWAAAAATTLPFSFSFYATAETQVWLGSTATLGFGMPALPPFGAFPDCSNPDPFTFYPAVVPFGDSNLVSGNVCFAITGTAPNRQFVATWENNTNFEPNFHLSFSAVLTETTNTVDLLYGLPGSGTDAGGSDAEASDAGGDAASGTTPVTDMYVAGLNATIEIQFAAGTSTVVSCDKAYLTVLPFDVRLTPQ